MTIRRLTGAATVAVILCTGAGPAGAANVDNGRQIYVKHCQSCHGARGRGQLPGTPDFSRGEHLLQPDSRLAASIRDGRGMMPAFRAVLKDDELLDVVAYLRTLRR